LHLGALFFLAFEDWGSITRQVFDALQGCLATSPQACGVLTVEQPVTAEKNNPREVNVCGFSDAATTMFQSAQRVSK
jgi:hypothetical protein